MNLELRPEAATANCHNLLDHSKDVVFRSERWLVWLME